MVTIRSRKQDILPVEISPVKNAVCFENGLNALVLLAQKGQYSVQIYEMDTPKGKHAYLIYKNQVFNSGITWPNDFYPDYTLDELQRNGIDVTQKLIEEVLGYREDRNNYRNFIKKKFGDMGISTLANVLIYLL